MRWDSRLVERLDEVEVCFAEQVVSNAGQPVGYEGRVAKHAEVQNRQQRLGKPLLESVFFISPPQIYYS